MRDPIGWWFEWSDRMYYRSCGTIWWRFWFEVTGQGHGARRYMREMYGQRWWETRKRARRRSWERVRRDVEAWKTRKVDDQ